MRLESNLSESLICGSDHSQICGNDLLDVWHTLDSQTLEDKSDGLNHHGMVLRERWVPDNPHQGCYGDGGVYFLQCGGSGHIGQHLTRVLCNIIIMQVKLFIVKVLKFTGIYTLHTCTL